jgi:hypothetical protein
VSNTDIKKALDNLPAEVQHLLVEIKHKDTKAQGKPLPT